jgi:hypothetical protein
MKKILAILTLFTCAFATPLVERKVDLEAVKSLSSELGISPEGDWVEEIQKQWLRKPNQERWELAERSEREQSIVFNWIERYRFFDEWLPSESHYDKAFIFGATTFSMQKRLEHLLTLWQRGVRFDEVIWLTGERPLDEKADHYLEFCKTESEAAKLLWDLAELPLELRELPVVFVQVPMKKEGANLQRPNTYDTLAAWLALESTNGQEPRCTALFITTQPYCQYQFEMTRKALPESVLFDVASPSMKTLKASVILDTLARTVCSH